MWQLHFKACCQFTYVLHCVLFSKQLSVKISSNFRPQLQKTQHNVVNECVNGAWQLGFIFCFKFLRKTNKIVYFSMFKRSCVWKQRYIERRQYKAYNLNAIIYYKAILWRCCSISFIFCSTEKLGNLKKSITVCWPLNSYNLFRTIWKL